MKLNWILSSCVTASLSFVWIAGCQSSSSESPTIPSGASERSCQSSIANDANELVENADLKGMAVMAGGALTNDIEIIAGSWPTDEPAPIASASKLLAVIVVLSVLDAHDIDIDDEIGRHLTVSDPLKSTITIRQLLSHTAGIPPRAVFRDLKRDGVTASANRILLRELDHEPGTAFSYGGSSFQVAGGVVESITGQSWNELVDEHLSRPLALSATKFAHPTALNHDGTPQLGGGAWSTLSDLSLILSAITERNARLRLSDESWDSLFSNNIDDVDARIAPRTAGSNFGYSLGLWNDCRPSAALCNTWHSAGAFGTIPRLNSETEQWSLVMTKGRLRDTYAESIKLLNQADSCQKG